MTRINMVLQRHIQGFTLLEVMVAMAIIAITLGVIFDSQSTSLSLACEAKFNTTGPLLAQKKISELESIRTEDIFSASGEFEDFPGYRWKLQVEEPAFDFPENVSTHLKQLDLTITWGEDETYSYHLRLFRFAPT